MLLSHRLLLPSPSRTNGKPNPINHARLPSYTTSVLPEMCRVSSARSQDVAREKSKKGREQKTMIITVR